MDLEALSIYYCEQDNSLKIGLDTGKVRHYYCRTAVGGPISVK